MNYRSGRSIASAINELGVGVLDIDEASRRMPPEVPQRPSAARTLSVVYVAWGATLAGNQLFTIVLFFILPAAQVGLVNWGTAAGALIFYIVEGGVATALVIAAKHQEIRLATMTLAVGAIRLATAAVALAAWLVGVALGRLHGAEATVLLLVGVGFVLRSLQTPFMVSLQVHDRQAAVAIAQFTQVIGRFAALALALALGIITVPSVLVASLAGDALALVVLAEVARRQPPRVTPTQSLSVRPLVGHLVRAAPGLTASQAVLMIQARFDWLLVAAFASYAALANYSIANKGLELLVLVGAVFARNALPWFVEGWGSRNLTNILRVLMGGATVLGFAMAIWGTPILHFAFGSKYASASQVIPILAALAPALVLLQIVQFALLGKGFTGDTVVAGGAGVAAQIVVDLLTIPSIGIRGAAYGMVAFAGVAFPALLFAALARRVIPRAPATELALGAAFLPVVLLVLSRLVTL